MAARPRPSPKSPTARQSIKTNEYYRHVSCNGASLIAEHGDLGQPVAQMLCYFRHTVTCIGFGLNWAGKLHHFLKHKINSHLPALE